MAAPALAATLAAELAVVELALVAPTVVGPSQPLSLTGSANAVESSPTDTVAVAAVVLVSAADAIAEKPREQTRVSTRAKVAQKRVLLNGMACLSVHRHNRVHYNAQEPSPALMASKEVEIAFLQRTHRPKAAKVAFRGQRGANYV